MADTNNPFSVRMDPDDKDKLLKFIEESGKSNKDFMNVLMSAYELNKAKIEIPDIAKDIEGLEALTQRINEYYVNIGKRIIDTQKAKEIEFTKELEIYKHRVEGLKESNDKIQIEIDRLTAAYNNACEDIEEYKKQNKQLEDILSNNKELIDQYKDKIDMLTGMLQKYEKYPEEIEQLKLQLEDIKNSNAELVNSNNQKDINLKEAQRSMAELDNKHNTELAAVIERANFEKDKALLIKDREHQDSIVKLNEQNSNKIKELLEEREKFDNKITDLMQESQSKSNRISDLEYTIEKLRKESEGLINQLKYKK